MRLLALFSGSIIALAAAAGQDALPPVLTKDLDILSKVPSLSVAYTVRPLGKPAMPYKLVFSRPGMVHLTGPDGFIVSDGAMVSTYTAATKSYTQEPYTEAWAVEFARRPEVAPWAPFLLKVPAADIASATAGLPKKIGGFDVTEVVVVPKRGTGGTLNLDRKLGVTRSALLKVGKEEQPLLIQATDITIGTTPAKPEEFAFVAPEGSTKVVAATTVTFAQVKALIDDRCMPCHAAARPRAGVNLETYEGVKATVVPGDPAASMLIKSVKGDGVRKMPLGNHPALTADEIKMWSDWIVAGAKNG